MPRTCVSTSFQTIVSSRGPCSASSFSGVPSAEPISQQSTLTASRCGVSVASRSGSASTPSTPASWIRATPWSVRLVPRTMWPPAMSSPASERPRQPQPTIRIRATLELVPGSVDVAAFLQLALGGIDLRADLVLGELGPAAAAPALVLRLQHLVDVLQLQPDLVLVRARGLPVEHFCPTPRVPPADPDQDQDQSQDSRRHDEGEIHPPSVAG